jgi:hypothetical protein
LNEGVRKEFVGRTRHSKVLVLNFWLKQSHLT